MLLIATDEAGYGPKLGPLVVAAVVGRIECDLESVQSEQIASAFEPMTGPVVIDGKKVRVDDSKSVYKPGVGLTGLHHVVSASHHWCDNRLGDVVEMLRHVARGDQEDISAAPWLREIEPQTLTPKTKTTPAINQWRSAGFDLIDIQARIITARRFNCSCCDGSNKADLLTRSTLGLIHDAITRNKEAQDIQVYCDRHGGRRYYADAIRGFFPDANIEAVSETSLESVYQGVWHGRQIRFAFTVKGDRFIPVALASMHAKYLRERLMDALNGYFLSRFQGQVSPKPTAGYPVDADRFLKEISSVIDNECIERGDLVRAR
jgi:ribonuclease HII